MLFLFFSSFPEEGYGGEEVYLEDDMDEEEHSERFATE